MAQGTATSAAGEPIPTLGFDSADFPAGQGLAIWAATAPYDFRLPDGAAPAQFRCRARAWRLDPLAVTAGSQSAIHFVRTPERVRADGRDNLCLMLTLDGGWSGEFDGLDIEVPRGRVGVIDFARPFASRSPDTDFAMLSIPRPLLDDGGADWHGRVLDGIAGRMLANHLAALPALLPEACAADAPAIAGATLAMVRSCLAQTPRRERSRAVLSLRQRVRRHVGAHLTDPALTPERVADALGITRSTLYRAFPSAGVSRYIQGRRLEAIRALLDTPGETRSLLTLATDFGFASHAHFTTAFGRRFGYPPSRARRRGEGRVAGGGTAAAFQGWIADLDASAHAGTHAPRSGAR